MKSILKSFGVTNVWGLSPPPPLLSLEALRGRNSSFHVSIFKVTAVFFPNEFIPWR